MSCGAQLIDLNGTCLESQGNVRNREFNSFQVEYGIEKRFFPLSASQSEKFKFHFPNQSKTQYNHSSFTQAEKNYIKLQRTRNLLHEF